jgi:hypothetical protein
MKQQHMAKEMIEYDNSLPDNNVCAINAIWDQSAKIFTAVINNNKLLPDDGENETQNRVAPYKMKHRGTSGFNEKTKTPLTKLALAHLQEEHALWLR